jgi:hypothetical protein
MGMDVYGRAPTSATGEYFRNNVWWWRPLADFIIANYTGDIKRIDGVSWHTNDGEGLGKRDSLKLANLLKRDLENGKVAAFEKTYEAARKSISEEPCFSCHGTGMRVITNREPCFSCNGKGTTPPWSANYPFSADNVAEFERFLRDSGGFRIH